MKWYVVYTKPRWEKKIAARLQEKSIEAYCPLNKVQKQWSDRKKIVFEPLFKGYVFIRIADEARWDVKQVDGILNYVYWNGKPAVVRDEEIENIQKFLSEFIDVSVEDLSIGTRSAVRIRQGVLMNYKGIVLEIVGNKAKVLVESMGLQLSAYFDKKNLEPVYPSTL